MCSFANAQLEQSRTNGLLRDKLLTLAECQLETLVQDPEVEANDELLGFVFSRLGWVRIHLGKTREAKRAFIEALTTLDRGKDCPARALSYWGLAKVFLRTGQTEHAKEHLINTLHACDSVGILDKYPEIEDDLAQVEITADDLLRLRTSHL